MDEYDPTATDGQPDEVAEPSPPVEAEVPPADYEPQPDLQPGQEGGVHARASDAIEEAEETLATEEVDELDAEDGDDDAVDEEGDEED